MTSYSTKRITTVFALCAVVCVQVASSCGKKKDDEPGEPTVAITVTPSTSPTTATAFEATFTLTLTPPDDKGFPTISAVNGYYTVDGTDPVAGTSTAIAFDHTAGTTTDTGAIAFTSTTKVAIAATTTLKFLGGATIEMKRVKGGMLNKKEEIETKTIYNTTAQQLVYTFPAATSSSSSSSSSSSPSSTATTTTTTAASSTCTSTAHIIYADTTNKALKYATNKTGSWVASAVYTDATADSIGTTNSLAIDADGRLHALFHHDPSGSNHTLKYTNNISGSWMTPNEVLTSGNSGLAQGLYGSVALTSGGIPHAAQVLTQGSELQHKVSSGYYFSSLSSYNPATSVTVDTPTSLVLGPSDAVNLIYRASGVGLRYAYGSANSYTVASIDTTNTSRGYFPSAVVSSTGTVSVVHFESATPKKVIFSTGSGSSFTHTQIDTDTSWVHPSLAQSTGDDLYMAYIKTVSGVYYVKVLKLVSGTWSEPTSGYAITGSGSNELRYTSLAIDNSGYVHVAVQDFDGGDLIYSTNKSGSWASTTVDSTGQVGLSPSIAVTCTKGRSNVTAGNY